MDLIKLEIENFQKIVSIADEATMVLKSQLLIEQSLGGFVACRINDEELVRELQHENSAVRNGKALIQLAQALAARDVIPITEGEKIWPSLYAINSVRNALAHSLDPDRRKIDNHMRKISKTVLNAASNDLQKDFYDATLLLIAYLGINREPSDLTNVDWYQ